MKSPPAAALVVLIALLVAAVALVGVELGKGAASSGPTVTNPCKPRAPFPGSGLDATIQRIVLDGLDGAACSLHTTREELVLSLGPESDVRPRRWTSTRSRSPSGRGSGARSTRPSAAGRSLR